MAVALGLAVVGHSQGQGEHLVCIVVVAGAVQVGSSTVASLNSPGIPAPTETAIHSYVAIVPSESADVAWSWRTVPPSYVLFLCLDADRRVGTGDRDHDTSAAACRLSTKDGPSSVAGGHSQGQGELLGGHRIVAGAVQVTSSTVVVTRTSPTIGN